MIKLKSRRSGTRFITLFHYFGLKALSLTLACVETPFSAFLFCFFLFFLLVCLQSVEKCDLSDAGCNLNTHQGRNDDSRSEKSEGLKEDSATQ